MHLYSLTIQKASGITAAVFGNFSAPKQQELIVARGKILELMRPDDNGKVQTIHSSEVFGIIRSIATFRLTGPPWQQQPPPHTPPLIALRVPHTGGSRDYVVVGSDSGKIVIVEYSVEKGCFEKVHAEVYGKSGCRRIVPGQFVATDPRGRAVMIGAIEKQKLVYILNRDTAARLTISSPLEVHPLAARAACRRAAYHRTALQRPAPGGRSPPRRGCCWPSHAPTWRAQAHKSNTLTFHMVGVDVGFDNPIFAALEVDTEEVENDPDTNEAPPRPPRPRPP